MSIPTHHYDISEPVEVLTDDGWIRGIPVEYHPNPPDWQFVPGQLEDDKAGLGVKLLTTGKMRWVPARRENNGWVRPAGDRDPERIDRLLAALREHWTRHPNRRLVDIVQRASHRRGVEDSVIETWLATERERAETTPGLQVFDHDWWE